MSLTATVATGGSGEAEAVVTRSPWGPCVAAWLFPGGGHLAIGQVVPGLVFAAVVFATFATGVLLQGTVYARDPEQPLSNLALVANLGAGPLDLWARHVTFGRLAYRIPDSRVDPVGRERMLGRLRERLRARSHAYGRTFLLTAGLMNLLLILDVFDHCIGRKGGAAVRSAGPDDSADGEPAA